MNRKIIIDDYLEKPYWVIDILPKQVPADSRGQFFTIEQYFLSDEQAERRCRQFCNILMKLNCYEDIAVCGLSEEWVVNPHPVDLTINGDDIYMTVYNPDEALLHLLRPLAASEGLFLWKPSGGE